MDYQSLAQAIDAAIIDDLLDIAADKEFELGEVVEWSISAFQTEKLGILALSFQLIYKASVSSLDEEAHTEATLTVRGDCSFDVSKEVASDVRRESVTLTDSEGKLIPGKSLSYLYAGGPVRGGGLRRRPYELRIPLEGLNES